MSEKFYTKGIYSSGMVLQRNTTNCIFGCGEAGKSVELKFREKTYSCQVTGEGQWKIEFNPGEAGGPFKVELTSQNDQITFDDVFVGEVWVNSGQSNAQLPMVRMQYSYPEEFELPKNNNVRMITIPINYNFDGEQDSVVNPQWKAAGPETLGEMSGTGYFFAKKISQELGVPVGIINSSQGGSPISAWMNKDSLKELGTMQKCIDELEKWENPGSIEEKKQNMQKNQSEWEAEISSADEGNKNHWENIPFEQIANSWKIAILPGDVDYLGSAGILWFKKEVELTEKQAELLNANTSNLWLGTIVDADIAYVNGTKVGITYYSYPPRRYDVPKGLYKTGKNTITIRVQKNSVHGPVRFYTEKPCCLFTKNVKVAACAFRNVEKPEGKISAVNKNIQLPEDGVYIDLAGEWKMEAGCKVRDCPAGMFFEWVPTALFNAMLSPCFNYAVAGALWYQGESDAYQPEAYTDLLKKMIGLWRNKFVYAPKDMPFVIMQLPNWSDGNGEDYVNDAIGWPKMRQSQQKAVEETVNVGLAVTIDGGEWNDLHPEKKRTCGTRAAMEALKIAYKKTFNSAPKMVKTELKDEKVVVTFDCGTASLKCINCDNGDRPLIPGFYFLCNSGVKLEAKGNLVNGTQVEIDLPPVGDYKVQELRYMWSQSPNPICLYSTEGLPAAPFSAEL